jgi:tetratricopeptide (TPR) repeat protein
MLVLLAAAATAAAWPGYRYWVRYRTDRYLADCKAAKKAGDWKSLDEVSRQWLAFDEQSGDAWLYLAVAAQEQKDIALAADCLDRVPVDHPKRVPALTARIELLLDLNRPLEAEEACREVLKLDPFNSRAHRRLIFLLAFSLRRVELARQIRESIELRGEPPEAYPYLMTLSSLQFASGQKMVGEWLSRHPDFEPFVVAYAYFRAVNPEDKAATLFMKSPGHFPTIGECLKQHPKNPEVISYFLQKAVEAGDVDRVAKLLRQADGAKETGSRCYSAEGWYHSARNQLPQAEAAYRNALKADPYNWRARHELATVLRLRGRVTEGARHAEIALVGKRLVRKLLEMTNVDALTPALIREMADYAVKCADEKVAAALLFRLQLRRFPFGPAG